MIRLIPSSVFPFFLSFFTSWFQLSPEAGPFPVAHFWLAGPPVTHRLVPVSLQLGKTVQRQKSESQFSPPRRGVRHTDVSTYPRLSASFFTDLQPESVIRIV